MDCSGGHQGAPHRRSRRSLLLRARRASPGLTCGGGRRSQESRRAPPWGRSRREAFVSTGSINESRTLPSRRPMAVGPRRGRRHDRVGLATASRRTHRRARDRHLGRLAAAVADLRDARTLLGDVITKQSTSRWRGVRLRPARAPRCLVRAHTRSGSVLPATCSPSNRSRASIPSRSSKSPEARPNGS